MRTRELRAHKEQLGFTPQDQVRWLSPAQLARTGVKVALAEMFADYSDKREIQAALRSGPVEVSPSAHEADEIWLDFVADLGDGFDATSTVAHTIAAGALTVTDTAGHQHHLKRGDVLVLGGDEVYPTASAVAYEDRLKGPYQAALPAGEAQPLLVALPGNHDWYDGLTSFLRLFTQRQQIGSWQTKQTRSYFVVQLPQRWWLVGLDSQLGDYIDEPQLEYFRQHLSAHLEPGDAVVVCSAEPTWVSTVDKDVDAFNALHWFDRKVIRTRTGRDGNLEETGASVRVWLTGDRHHYARYAEQLPGEQAVPGTALPPDEQRTQMVTCGLGGAYLSSTHWLPEKLRLPPPGSRIRTPDEPARTFVRGQTTYPDASTSRSLAKRLAYPWSEHWLARRNPGFPTVAAGVHVAGFLILSMLLGWFESRQPIDAVRSVGLAGLLGFLGIGLVIGLAAAIPALFGWVRGRLRAGGARAGGAGAAPPGMIILGLLQIAVAIVILAVAAAIPWPVGWAGWVVLPLCVVIAAALGAVLGSEGFALFTLAATGGQAADWQMSGQSVEDYKGFLRLHIAPGGALTIYPLVIDQVCHEWELADDTAGGTRPVPASPLPPPRLVEDPVVVARKVGAS